MLSAAGISARQRFVQVINSTQTWVVPAGVSQIDSISGFGARGTDATVGTRYSWDRYATIYYYGKDGNTYSQFTGQVTSGTGRAPANYCDALVNEPPESAYFQHQTCYEYFESSENYNIPAQPGEPASAFNLSFPGSVGNVQPGITTFYNVAVTPGSSNTIVVPAGGSITIIYYK